jgi:hypothetical protein
VLLDKGEARTVNGDAMATEKYSPPKCYQIMVEAGRKPATKLIGFHLRGEDHSQTINGRLKGPFCEIERLRLGAVA